MIIFLYGKDTYRSRQKLRELKEKFKRDVDATGGDIITIDGEKATLAAIHDAAETGALFSRKRMVVVEYILDCGDPGIFLPLIELIEQLDKKNADNIVVFFDKTSPAEKLASDKKKLFDALRSAKYAQEFPPLNGSKLLYWIKAYVSSSNAMIAEAEMTCLSGFANGDLWLITNELDKLIHYKRSISAEQDKVTVITRSDLELLAFEEKNSGIFDLTDALGSSNRAKAANLIDNLLDGSSNDLYQLAMIAKHYKNLLRTREALDLGMTTRKISNELKLHPFAAQKCILQVRRLFMGQIMQKANYLIKADIDYKQGRCDLRTALSLLIMDN